MVLQIGDRIAARLCHVADVDLKLHEGRIGVVQEDVERHLAVDRLELSVVVPSELQAFLVRFGTVAVQEVGVLLPVVRAGGANAAGADHLLDAERARDLERAAPPVVLEHRCREVCVVTDHAGGIQRLAIARRLTRSRRDHEVERLVAPTGERLQRAVQIRLELLPDIVPTALP